MNRTIALLSREHVRVRFRSANDTTIRCDLDDGVSNGAFASGLGSTAEASLIDALRSHKEHLEKECEKVRDWLLQALDNGPTE